MKTRLSFQLKAARELFGDNLGEYTVISQSYEQPDFFRKMKVVLAGR